MALALHQLGYKDDVVPSIYVIIPDEAHVFEYKLKRVEDIELPFWTGDAFCDYVKAHFKVTERFFLRRHALVGDLHLYYLGLRADEVNIAIPEHLLFPGFNDHPFNLPLDDVISKQ